MLLRRADAGGREERRAVCRRGGILVAALAYVVGWMIRVRLVGALLGQGTCLVAGAGIGGDTLLTKWFVRRAMGHVARSAGRQSAVGMVLGERSQRTSKKGLACGESATTEVYIGENNYKDNVQSAAYTSKISCRGAIQNYVFQAIYPRLVATRPLTLIHKQQYCPIKFARKLFHQKNLSSIDSHILFELH